MDTSRRKSRRGREGLGKKKGKEEKDFRGRRTIRASLNSRKKEHLSREEKKVQLKKWKRKKGNHDPLEGTAVTLPMFRSKKTLPTKRETSYLGTEEKKGRRTFGVCGTSGTSIDPQRTVSFHEGRKGR